MATGGAPAAEHPAAGREHLLQHLLEAHCRHWGQLHILPTCAHQRRCKSHTAALMYSCVAISEPAADQPPSIDIVRKSPGFLNSALDCQAPVTAPVGAAVAGWDAPAGWGVTGRDGSCWLSWAGGPSSSTLWRATGLTPALVTATPPNMTCTAGVLAA